MRRLSPPRGWTRRYASSIWLYSLWGTAALLFLHLPRGMQAFVPWCCPLGTTYIDGVTKRRRLMKRPGSTPDGIIASTLDSIPSIPRRSAHDCGNSRYHEASHLSIHASAAAAAVPGSLGGGGMHIPPSRSKPGSGGTFSSSTHAGAVITPTPAPPAILTEKDRVTRPQRQLVWGEEELRLRIREVEGAVETLRATALALCREGRWVEAEKVVLRLYRGNDLTGERKRSEAWDRDGVEGYGGRNGGFERVGSEVSHAYLKACITARAWPAALSFLDQLLSRNVVGSTGEAGQEGGGKSGAGGKEGAAPALALLDVRVAEAAWEVCAGAGDASRILAVLRCTQPHCLGPAVLDVAMDACLACQRRLLSSLPPSAGAGAAKGGEQRTLRQDTQSRTSVRALEASCPSQVGVTVLSVLREARKRIHRGGAGVGPAHPPPPTRPSPPPSSTTSAPGKGGSAPKASTGSAEGGALPSHPPALLSSLGWETAAEALPSAAFLRLLLGEAKLAAASMAPVHVDPAAPGRASCPASPSVPPLPPPSSLSFRPPMLLLYARAIQASVVAGEIAEALLLYNEALALVEGGMEGGRKGTAVALRSSNSGSDGSSERLPLSIHEAALAAHAVRGDWQQALGILDRLRKEDGREGGREGGGEGGGPSLACFNSAIRACCVGDEWERGVGLLRRMERAGVRANEETYGVILQAFRRTGAWEGSLKLVQYLGKGGGEGVGAGQQPLTPALAQAAAEICLRAGRYAEARTVVDSVLKPGTGPLSSPPPTLTSEHLALGLWALAAMHPSTGGGRERQEEAHRLITALMASNVPIARATYEHACYMLSLHDATDGPAGTRGSSEPGPSSRGYKDTLRRIYGHGVAAGVLPSIGEASAPAVLELRGLGPTLARLALVMFLETWGQIAFTKDAEASPGLSASQPASIVIITGPGRLKATVQQFLRRACLPSLRAQPLPYNPGRLILPLTEVQHWHERAGIARLSWEESREDCVG